MIKTDTGIILYEDKDLIVCHKKAGTAVQHKSSGIPDLESMLRNALAAEARDKEKERIPYLAVVHRLDQPVEGVMVFARNKNAAANLSAQMTAGKMGKEYLAVVQGSPESDCGEEWHFLRDLLLRDGRSNTSRIVTEGTAGAKEARMSFRAVEDRISVEGEPGTLIQIRLETGRHHQIRVQLSGAGMPILGDRKYSGRNPDGTERWKRGFPLCLAAWRLSFCHPRDGHPMQFTVIPEFLKEKSGNWLQKVYNN